MIGIETSVLKSKKKHKSSNELISVSQVGYTRRDILLFNDGNYKMSS